MKINLRVFKEYKHNSLYLFSIKRMLVFDKNVSFESLTKMEDANYICTVIL